MVLPCTTRESCVQLGVRGRELADPTSRLGAHTIPLFRSVGNRHNRVALYHFGGFEFRSHLGRPLMAAHAYFMGTVDDQRDDCRLQPNREATKDDLARIGVEMTTVISYAAYVASLPSSSLALAQFIHLYIGEYF